jgi:competence protein ComEA
MPAQRAQRQPDVNDRLVRMKDARAEHHAPADTDQDWIDESSPGPEPEEAPSPWWRRAEPGRLVERWLPGGLPARSRRKLSVAVVIGLALGTVVAVALLVPSHGGHEPSSVLPAAQPTPDSAEPEPTRNEASIVVSVVGRVVRPGLVSLPDGSRVNDALRAAGGAQPGVDLAGLNLARKLTDGEQISVGVPAAAEPGPAAPGAPEKVDLNSATLTQLDTLPGVGSVTAQRILDWRSKHGHFTRVDQLRDIDGIGPSKFNQLKDLVVVR